MNDFRKMLEAIEEIVSRYYPPAPESWFEAVEPLRPECDALVAEGKEQR